MRCALPSPQKYTKLAASTECINTLSLTIYLYILLSARRAFTIAARLNLEWFLQFLLRCTICFFHVRLDAMLLAIYTHSPSDISQKFSTRISGARKRQKEILHFSVKRTRTQKPKIEFKVEIRLPMEAWALTRARQTPKDRTKGMKNWFFLLFLWIFSLIHLVDLHLQDFAIRLSTFTVPHFDHLVAAGFGSLAYMRS